MGSVILLRHGRSVANAGHILAGRTAGVALDPRGRTQAAGLVSRLSAAPITAITSSPLQRCRDTVAPLAHARGLTVTVDEDLAEVDYGAWTGRALSDLRQDPLWSVVQDRPSEMIFPAGEAFTAVWARAGAALRRWSETDAVTVVCSHGDIIAMMLASALGLPLDEFQRIVVAPASLSVVQLGGPHPMVLSMNTAGTLPWQRTDRHGGRSAAAGRPVHDGPALPVLGGITGE